MFSLKINNEFGALSNVILGVAYSFGGTPKIDECYDPKSRENILNGTFPNEKNLIAELNNFLKVLEKYNVNVIRPETIENCNQIFTRDIAFVIDEKIIVSGIIDERKKEIDGIEKVFSKISSDKIITLSNDARIEGGDVILDGKNIYIGYSKEDDFNKYKVARTNEKAINEIKILFPNKNIFSFELNKSDLSARDNALHLDCCFQPIGKNKAIIYEGGFKNYDDVLLITEKFGDDVYFWYGFYPMAGVIEGFRSAFIGMNPMPWDKLLILITPLQPLSRNINIHTMIYIVRILHIIRRTIHILHQIVIVLRRRIF